MPRVPRTASLLLLAALAAAPGFLRAFEESERGWQELNQGNLVRARWLFEQALTQDPCEAEARKGYVKAGGSLKGYASDCGQDAAEDQASALASPEASTAAPDAAAAPEAAAAPAEAVAPAPVKLTAAQKREAKRAAAKAAKEAARAAKAAKAAEIAAAKAAKAEAKAAKIAAAKAAKAAKQAAQDAAKLAAASPAKEASELADTPSEAADRAEALAAQAKGTVPAGKAPEANPVHEATVTVLWFALGALALFAIVAGIVAWFKRMPDRKPAAKAAPEIKIPASIVKLVAQHDAAAAAEAASLKATEEDPAVEGLFAPPKEAEAAEPAESSVEAPPPSFQAAPAPVAASPRLEEAGAAPIAAPKLRSQPFAPDETVLQSLKAGPEEVFLTDKKLYWSGARTLLGNFGNALAPLTAAVPFSQITGLAWAKPKGGEVLIIGTALAGDIGLKVSTYGDAPLRGFAKALSEAMDKKA